MIQFTGPARPLLSLAGVLAGPRRLTVAVALMFGVVAVGLLGVHPAYAWEQGTFSGGSESQLIALQNQARASAGLNSLKPSTDLRTIARWRSKDMADRDYFSHTIKGTNRDAFWYMQYEYSYCFRLAGENIGTVTWPGATEEDATNWILDEFMNSAGHRKNILGTAWDVVAVGAYRTTGDTFLWTVLFVDSCSTTPAATPKPTPKATPRPTPQATPRPTPKPTPKPAPTATPRPTPRPEVTTAPRPTAAATPQPELVPTESPMVAPSASPWPAPGDEPTPDPAGGAGRAGAPNGNVPPGQFRIVDGPVDRSLAYSILGVVTAQFFGW